jgi:hypothetical protein
MIAATGYPLLDCTTRCAGSLCQWPCRLSAPLLARSRPLPAGSPRRSRCDAVRSRARLTSLLPWLIPIATVGLLWAPMPLTSRGFGPDWGWHMWLMWNQGESIAAVGHPTYFVHAHGLFYPHFAFYGGTLYSTGGFLAMVLGGQPDVAYIGLYLAGFVMAYGGCTWLAHIAGLRGWIAQMPGLVFVSSAYYLTNAYARGVWGEFVGTSALPLAVASAVSILRSDRWRPAPLLGLVVSIVVLTGSHNITTLWGSLFLAAVAVIGTRALPRRGREIPRQRMIAVGALGVLAVGVNAWYLVPDALYGGKVFLSGLHFLGDAVSFLGTPQVVFHPTRLTPAASTTPSLYVQVPVFALLWALCSLVITRRVGLAPLWRRLGLGLAILGAALLVLVLFDGAWQLVPPLLQYIQFPYRVHTYVALTLTGLVLVGLVGATSRPHGRHRFVLLSSLAVVAAYGLGLGVYQVWSTPSTVPDRQSVLESRYTVPVNTRAGADFNDESARVVRVAPGRRIILPPDLLTADEARVTVGAPAGSAPIETNIAGGPYFVELKGMRRVGRTEVGTAVVRRPPGREAGPLTVELSPRASPPIVAGRAISLFSLVAVTLLIAGLVRRGRRGDPPAAPLRGDPTVSRA